MVTNIPSDVLRQLVKLSERKDDLLDRAQKIEQQMLGLQRQYINGSSIAGTKARVTVSRAAGTSRRRHTRRGALREKILRALQKAGNGGLTVRELSDALKVRTANLYVWFNATGSKVPGLKKIGPAKYRLGK